MPARPASLARVPSRIMTPGRPLAPHTTRETTSADQESPSLETRIARSLRQACRSVLGKSPRVVVHVFRPDQPGNVGI